MQLDLTGQTVTQAIATFRQALTQCTEPELEVKTDNEVVKLNLYNHIHKIGLRCKMDRDGVAFVFRIKTGKSGSARGTGSPAGGFDGSLAVESTTKTAFPIGHLSASGQGGGSQPARETGSIRSEFSERDLSPRERRALRRQRREAEAAAAAMATPAGQAVNARPAPVANPMPQQQVPVPEPVHVPVAQNTAVPRILVIQNDQIGQKDIALGVTLLEELLNNLDPRVYSLIFCVHRGVRILDPAYHQGRILNLLLQKHVRIAACARSLEFYQLTEKVPTNIEVLPLHRAIHLGSGQQLDWI